jgi:hypothetical protein
MHIRVDPYKHFTPMNPESAAKYGLQSPTSYAIHSLIYSSILDIRINIEQMYIIFDCIIQFSFRLLIDMDIWIA